MHIFCPNCGKHIDVSIKEIERLEGHYLCPQCLVDIDLEGFEQNTRDFDYQDYDNEETAQSQPAPSVKSVPEPETRPTATPPAYKAPEPAAPAPAPHKDDVIRYCKRCGAFLRQGVSYCPKCGNYVKVKPPTYRGTGSQATAGAASTMRQPQPYPSNAARPVYPPRQRVRPPMASKTRKPSSSKNNINPGQSSKGIFSLLGCITLTVIVVALFFIVYILVGGNFDVL